jgi:hypothetical protein
LYIFHVKIQLFLIYSLPRIRIRILTPWTGPELSSLDPDPDPHGDKKPTDLDQHETNADPGWGKLIKSLV